MINLYCKQLKLPTFNNYEDIIRQLEWMYSFHSVATKYLANYMYWFKWLQFFITEKDTVKTKYLLVQSHTSHSDTKLKDFKIREAIYI